VGQGDGSGDRTDRRDRDPGHHVAVGVLPIPIELIKPLLADPVPMSEPVLSARATEDMPKSAAKKARPKARHDLLSDLKS
jgi:hypothetical protein